MSSTWSLGYTFAVGEFAHVVTFIGEVVESFSDADVIPKKYSQLSTCIRFPKSIPFSSEKWEEIAESWMKDKNLGLYGDDDFNPRMMFCVLRDDGTVRIPKLSQRVWAPHCRENRWTSIIESLEGGTKNNKNYIEIRGPFQLRMLRNPTYAKNLISKRAECTAENTSISLQPSIPLKLNAFQIKHKKEDSFSDVEMEWKVLISTVYLKEVFKQLSDVSLVIVEYPNRALLCRPPNLNNHTLNRVVVGKNNPYVEKMMYIAVEWDRKNHTSRLFTVLDIEQMSECVQSGELICVTSCLGVEKYLSGMVEGFPDAVQTQKKEELKRNWDLFMNDEHKVKEYDEDAVFMAYTNTDPDTSGRFIPMYNDTGFSELIDHRLRLYTRARTKRFHKLLHSKESQFSLKTRVDVMLDFVSFHAVHRSLFADNKTPYAVLNAWRLSEKTLFRKRMEYLSIEERLQILKLLEWTNESAAEVLRGGAKEKNKAVKDALEFVKEMFVLENADGASDPKIETWLNRRTWSQPGKTRIYWILLSNVLKVNSPRIENVLSMDWDPSDKKIQGVMASDGDSTRVLMTDMLFNEYLTHLFVENVLNPRSHDFARCECKLRLVAKTCECAKTREEWCKDPWNAHLGRLGLSRFIEWAREMIVVFKGQPQIEFDLSKTNSLVDLVRNARLPSSHALPAPGLFPPCIQKKLDIPHDKRTEMDDLSLFMFNLAFVRDDFLEQEVEEFGFKGIYNKYKPAVLAQLEYSKNVRMFGPHSKSIGVCPWICENSSGGNSYYQELSSSVEECGCQFKGFVEAVQKLFDIDLEDEKTTEKVLVRGAGVMIRTKHGIYAPSEINQPSDYTLGLLLIKFQKDHPTREVDGRVQYAFFKEKAFASEEKKEEEAQEEDEKESSAKRKLPTEEAVPNKQPKTKEDQRSVVDTNGYKFENQFFLDEVADVLKSVKRKRKTL